MTKRLSTGVVLAAFAIFTVAFTADAANKVGKEWRGKEDPAAAGLPLFFRSAAGTTWVDVGGACDPADSLNSTHSPSEVWCFEGANGDSTWPAEGSGKTWTHWSKFDPPLPPDSKWHITSRHPGPSTGSFNAWVGCDSLGTNPGCTDVGFWVFQEGYGDDWNFALTLDASGQDASTGGEIEFDLRYDVECNYDYMYLEYLNASSEWVAVTDTAGTAAVFNGVSGNLDSGNGGTGRPCGDDIYGHSDQRDPGGGLIAYHGNSLWLENVTFPLPAQAGGISLRWRGFSDGAWSDLDGNGDTDGIGAIDNVLVTFANSGNTVTDDFESATAYNDFSSSIVTSAGPAASWTAGGLEGNTYDGWHLTFDPTYKNKGNTCAFSNDWMWSSKPDGSAIPANGFSYFLASPVVNCSGWSGGAMEFANYLCAPDVRNDYTNTQARFYDSVEGWSPWQDFDGYITFSGCEFWNMNETENLTPFLGAGVDSLQMGYEMLDTCSDSDFCWGKHASVIWTVDNVSIGSYDGTATQFAASAITIFRDTFSRRDPAHTANLVNAEEGMWPGRAFAKQDSLQVVVQDFDGVTDGNVDLFWRVGTGTPPVFGAWSSKDMNLTQPDPISTTDEGTYSSTIGNGTTEDYGAGADIFDAGSTIEYYVECTDNGANVAYFPDITTGNPFSFQVLPLGREVNAEGEKILLVDDYTRNNLDFENSTGFDPTGGAGFGSFTAAVFDQPEDMVERALILLYGGDENGTNPPVDGGPKWDIYDVFGAGSSVQVEPRVIADAASGIGGIATDLGQPNYDAVIWLNGTFDAYSFADTTRMELKSYLDNGGNLLSSGDDVARFLSGNGNGSNADSTIQFLQTYLGTEYVQDDTSTRVLNVTGQPGSSLDGLVFGLYGECNGIRKAFDQLVGSASVATETVLAKYSDGGAADTNAAVIKNITTSGVAVHMGFGLENMLSDNSRACFLNAVLTTDFGMFATSYTGCENDGVDAPNVGSGRFGFELAQAAPNPFVDNTKIRYSVPSRQHVSIEVYNILGQKVRTLVDEAKEANSYVAEWDGRADGGARVSSGIYFYKMVSGEFSATKKAVLLK